MHTTGFLKFINVGGFPFCFSFYFFPHPPHPTLPLPFLFLSFGLLHLSSFFLFLLFFFFLSFFSSFYPTSFFFASFLFYLDDTTLRSHYYISKYRDLPWNMVDQTASKSQQNWGRSESEELRLRRGSPLACREMCLVSSSFY